jgi:hypothetical protein
MGDTNTFILGVLVALSTFLSPLLMAWLTNRNRQQERAQDFARQDLVAERANLVAVDLVKRQDDAAEKAATAARLLLAANERVAQTSKMTNDKLDVIHTLVNSNMTAALKAEFDATERELTMMIEVVELKRLGGHLPTVESLAAIEATRVKISELRSTLDDRAKAGASATPTVAS